MFEAAVGGWMSAYMGRRRWGLSGEGALFGRSFVLVFFPVEPPPHCPSIVCSSRYIQYAPFIFIFKETTG